MTRHATSAASHPSSTASLRKSTNIACTYSSVATASAKSQLSRRRTGGGGWWDRVPAPPMLVLCSKGCFKEPLQSRDRHGQQYPIHYRAVPALWNGFRLGAQTQGDIGSHITDAKKIGAETQALIERDIPREEGWRRRQEGCQGSRRQKLSRKCSDSREPALLERCIHPLPFFEHVPSASSARRRR